MKNDDKSSGLPLATLDPRTVTRGLKLQPVFIGIDSLYLVVEYPKKDIFDRWAWGIEDLHNTRLHKGIITDGFVIRRGGNGYKLSIWDGDARLYLTDRVEETLLGGPYEGQGMGAMLQLGPKWLRQYGEHIEELVLNAFGQLIIFGIDNPEGYKIRLNRLDLAIDFRDLLISEFDVDVWRNNWVDYAKKIKFYTGQDPKKLETVSIGSGQGSVKFKAYDKVEQSKKDRDLRFWKSVWGVQKEKEIKVTRCEWSIRCYRARFSRIKYIIDLDRDRISSLLNYVAHKWGRLCQRDNKDKNQSRWPVSPLWLGIQIEIENWTDGNDLIARRKYDFRSDITETYLNSFSGWLSGLMVRIGLENELDEPADLDDTFLYLEKRGYPVIDLTQRAKKKWMVEAKLAGKEVKI